MRTEIITSLAQVDAAAWDALTGDNNPFIEHAFLSLMETSGSVGVEVGWEPHHVLVWEGDQLVGAAPAYLKDNSYGEYIFDWSWADAAHRLGIPYFPKLVIAAPFTPATGPRLLVHPNANKEDVWHTLLNRLKTLVGELGAWSFHILFCTDEEADFIEREGYIRRATYQFHWRNNQYTSFDDFLGALRSRNRKQIRKERKKACGAGLEIELLYGDEATDEDWEMMYKLYMSTAARKWGQPYLTHDFFRQARTSLGARPLLLFARRDGEVRAGTLSFAKGKHVYGRYWGCFEYCDGLHFELCYYRLIEYAIERGGLLVEAGAQGQHKIKRGYLPVVTHSGHHFEVEELGHALNHIMQREASFMRKDIEEAQKDGPFREDSIPPFPARAGICLDTHT